MYNTNIFKEIKEYLNPQQVAEYYMPEKGKKSGGNVFYKSPFRNEKTASFCVNNTKGFHDYGTGWHGDIINFVAELYNVKPIEAAEMLIKDFALPIQIRQKVNYQEARKYRQKNTANNNVKETLQKWFNDTFIKLCKKNRENDVLINIITCNIKEQSDFDNEGINDALKYLYKKQNGLEMWIENFIEANTDKDKLELFRYRKEVEKYVDR